MIERRRTSKKCDVCGAEVAFKDTWRFRTVAHYITLPADFISLFAHTDPGETHICCRCWDQMKAVIRETLKHGERKDNE